MYPGGTNRAKKTVKSEVARKVAKDLTTEKRKVAKAKKAVKSEVARKVAKDRTPEKRKR